MKFRKRVKLFPGVSINLSRSGISTTIGIPGASVNFNKNGTFLNTGIPGTGLYDRKKIGGNQKNQYIPSEVTPLPSYSYQEDLGTIKTEDVESTTTEGLADLKQTLLDCYTERISLKQEIAKAKLILTLSYLLLVISYLLIVGFFVKWFKENKKTRETYLDDLKSQLENCFIDVDIDVDKNIEQKYLNLLESYKTLITSKRIWDITSTVDVDQVATRSAASRTVSRKAVSFKFGNIDIIKSKYDALHFENANGGDIYLYPAFLVIVDENKKFGLIDIRELNFDFHGQQFMEEENVFSDSTITRYTWAKVNKNGSPDKRFKNNYQIPVCVYGNFQLTTTTGLNEAYSVSSITKAEPFAKAMLEYQNIIN